MNLKTQDNVENKQQKDQYFTNKSPIGGLYHSTQITLPETCWNAIIKNVHCDDLNTVIEFDKRVVSGIGGDERIYDIAGVIKNILKSCIDEAIKIQPCKV